MTSSWPEEAPEWKLSIYTKGGKQLLSVPLNSGSTRTPRFSLFTLINHPKRKFWGLPSTTPRSGSSLAFQAPLMMSHLFSCTSCMDSILRFLCSRRFMKNMHYEKSCIEFEKFYTEIHIVKAAYYEIRISKILYPQP